MADGRRARAHPRRRRDPLRHGPAGPAPRHLGRRREGPPPNRSPSRLPPHRDRLRPPDRRRRSNLLEALALVLVAALFGYFATLVVRRYEVLRSIALEIDDELREALNLSLAEA